MAMMKQVILRKHPVGLPKPDDFAIESVERPVAGDGDVLLQTMFASVDPATRLSIDAKPLSAALSIGVGGVISSASISKIVATNNPNYKLGSFVESRAGWREYLLLREGAPPLRTIDEQEAPLPARLGVLGVTGQTAHACIVGIGRVAAGETVVISAAAGGVGSLAGQIAKIRGARVIGIAGGAAKCAAVEALGFDACVDYKAPDFVQRLAAACPNGVDVYVENVGGRVTDAVMPLLKFRARMPVSGLLSYYGESGDAPCPDRLPHFMRMAMIKGIEIKALVGLLDGGQAALTDLAVWLGQKKIRHPETFVDGIENAPRAFANIFAENAHVGKLILRAADL